MLGKEAFTPTGAQAAEIGLIKEVVPDGELLSRAQDLGESWIADPDRISEGRSHMGYTDTDKLIKVNEKGECGQVLWSVYPNHSTHPNPTSPQ